jgi:hypothetical protein
MQVHIYNAQHINCDERFLFIGRWWGGGGGHLYSTSQQEQSQETVSFGKDSVRRCIKAKLVYQKFHKFKTE